MSRVERALSLPRALPLRSPSTPSSSLPHVSTHTEGFIEIYSRLRLHVHKPYVCMCVNVYVRARTHERRARSVLILRMSVCVYVDLCVLSEVESRSRSTSSNFEPAVVSVRSTSSRIINRHAGYIT